LALFSVIKEFANRGQCLEKSHIGVAAGKKRREGIFTVADGTQRAAGVFSKREKTMAEQKDISGRIGRDEGKEGTVRGKVSNSGVPTLKEGGQEACNARKEQKRGIVGQAILRYGKEKPNLVRLDAAKEKNRMSQHSQSLM